ncbi:hypothetical protein D3C71_1362400 [compost metagenome]
MIAIGSEAPLCGFCSCGTEGIVDLVRRCGRTLFGRTSSISRHSSEGTELVVPEADGLLVEANCAAKTV